MDVSAALLADAARVADGKLYVHGGGWDRITASTFPSRHLSMAVALIFRVQYDEALTGQPVSISIHTEDGKQITPPVTHEVSAGHPPGTLRGAPSFVAYTLTMNLVEFEQPGAYYVLVMHKEHEMTRIPFTLQLPPGAQIENTTPDQT